MNKSALVGRRRSVSVSKEEMDKGNEMQRSNGPPLDGLEGIERMAEKPATTSVQANHEAVSWMEALPVYGRQEADAFHASQPVLSSPVMASSDQELGKPSAQNIWVPDDRPMEQNGEGGKDDQAELGPRPTESGHAVEGEASDNQGSCRYELMCAKLNGFL